MKTSLRSRLLFVPIILAVGTSPLFAASAAQSANVQAFLAQIRTATSVADQLKALTAAARGKSVEEKAALGAALIESVPANSRKDAATQVAQLLTGMKDGKMDVPQFASLLTGKLSGKLGAELAAPIVLGAARSEPALLPQITAAVIVTNPSTIHNAAAIAKEVTAASPLSKAAGIASAIGAAYAKNPQLVIEAPNIAAAMTEAMLPKGATDQVRPEVTSTITALTIMIPGEASKNIELISKIGAAVADVIKDKSPSLAAAIVSDTGAAIRDAAGSANVSSVVEGFANSFKNAINDPNIQRTLDAAVAQINSAPKLDSLGGAPASAPGTAAGSTSGGTGSLIPRETPDQNG